MHMVSGQQCLVSVLQYFSRAHSPRFAWLSFLLLMVGPGSGMLFCWLASKPIHLRASVEPANGSTRKGHARLWGGDFPSRLPSKSSQCFVFPQTSVLPKMLRPDPKRSHPSCNASELRHSISQYLFSPSLWSYCPRKMLAKVLGERAKCSEGRNRCMWRTPWTGNAGKNMGALRGEKGHSEQKAKVEFSSCYPREDFWGHPWSLWNLLSWQWVWAALAPRLRNLCSRNEVLGSMIRGGGGGGIFIHPMSISNWGWKCLYHLS